MRTATFIATLAAATVLNIVATAPAAFAANNTQSSTIRTKGDLEQNGWYCMRSSDGSYWLCTKVFDQTYTCQLGICWPTPIRSDDGRVSRMPNAGASLTERATPPQTRGIAAPRARLP